ncbi:hypothetical protein Leryth_014381 [Lithospermum erythrorhizon]|nr:hypothetical protein Leryth_014381 [Lithospermum erythrorhizon]
MSVMVVTSLGDLVIDLFTDRCPLTCKNFLKLCKTKYYNGCLFHTIQKDFTAQTGDPTGTGSGGDSVYKFLYGDQARFFGDEIHLDVKHAKTGTVAMASAGENLNASQFYITLRDDLDYLDGKHTVFGEIAEGFEALTRINEAYVDEKGRPYKNIRIKHTYVLDDPFDDPPLLSELIPDASPEGKPKDEVVDDVRLEDDWVPMDDQLPPQELEELVRSKEAHSRAVLLESIGDIPDAEVKPPDNVLFVCKLNPVTEDEDLHTIFSRFGTVTSADVIRDKKTGDSLCYAFIEFEDKESCEQAYFKMDNALIDDRRIHVDFSQSVAKLWSQYTRRKGQTGGGCFKCGSPDHQAKDCTGDPTNNQQNTKFILKEDNAQRGGNSGYEMVFAEDAAASPNGSKKPKDHIHNGKANHRGDDATDLADVDARKRDPRNQSDHRGRGNEASGDERYGRSRTKSYDERRDTRVKDEHHSSRRTDYARDGKYERELEKRHADGTAHRDRRSGREYERKRDPDVFHRGERYEKDHKRQRGDPDVGHKDERHENDYKRRYEDDAVRGDREDDRDSRRRGDDTNLREGHRHHADRHDSRRDSRDGSYSKRTGENNGREGRREDRDHEKSSSKVDDSRSRDRGRRH